MNKANLNKCYYQYLIQYITIGSMDSSLNAASKMANGYYACMHSWFSHESAKGLYTPKRVAQGPPILKGFMVGGS